MIAVMNFAIEIFQPNGISKKYSINRDNVISINLVHDSLIRIKFEENYAIEYYNMPFKLQRINYYNFVEWKSLESSNNSVEKYNLYIKNLINSTDILI